MKPLPGYEQYADIGFRVTDRLIAFGASIFTPLFATDTLTKSLLVLILAIALGFFLKGLLATRKLQGEEKEYLFLLISPAMIFGIYVLYPLPLWEHYLLPIAILAVFLLSLSIKRLFRLGSGYALVVILFLLLAVRPAVLWINNSYLSAARYMPVGDGSYRNQLAAAKWVVADSGNRSYGYFVYTTGSLTYSMDYLLWWVSQKERASRPSNQKHEVTYLILYPHAAHDDNAHAFWKKHVVRTTGTVIATKQFPGGITVEKVRIPATEEPADPNYYQGLIFR
jgi:hypothetical protein